MEAALGFEPRMKDLQSSALPLGDAATFNFYKDGAENGIWTRDPRLGKAMLYHWAISAKNLVPRPRIELGTRGFSVHCSTDWAISAFKSPYIIILLRKWRGRRDLNSRSPAWQAGVLNQAALRPHYIFLNIGRRNRAWTCDPWLVKPVLSQLSYPPTYSFFAMQVIL